MSSSIFDSPIDSVTQWIDTSLVSDPTLLSLMDLYSSQPFNDFEFTSSSTRAENTFTITANEALTNNCGLANDLPNGGSLIEAERKFSIVKSDATLGSGPTVEHTSQVQNRPVSDDVAKVKRERRRAQNRKAQQAFRKRKDTAIARLENEMGKLKSINMELSQTNRARLQEISELKARLGALWLAPPSPSIDGKDTEEEKKAELPPSFCVNSLSCEDPAKANTVLWIKWRGRVYIGNGALPTSSIEHGCSSCRGFSPVPMQRCVENY